MREPPTHTYAFADFQLDPVKRLLLRAGQPVTLSSKGFDLLLALVENSGRLLTKDELLKLVWVDQFVEEANLTVQVSAIRKVLGERKDEHRFLVTVPGSGYKFVAEVRSDAEASEIIADAGAPIMLTEEIETKPDFDLPNDKRDETQTLTTKTSAEPSGLKRTASRRAPFVFALVLTALLSAAIGYQIYQSRLQAGEKSAVGAQPPLKFKRFTTAGGAALNAAIAPDGKSLVYLQREKGNESLWLAQVETGSSVQIHLSADAVYGTPVFSPDSGSLYFTIRDERHQQPTLMKMSALGGALTEIISNVESPITFAPDGKHFAFVRSSSAQANQNSIVITNADDGKDERILATERFSTAGLSWSPDGQTIVIGAGRGADSPAHKIFSVNTTDGSIAPIDTKEWVGIYRLVWLPDMSALVVIAREKLEARGTQLWLVSYPDGTARQLTNETDNFQTNDLSLTADGKTLLALKSRIDPQIWIAPLGRTDHAKRILSGTVTRYEGMLGLAWTPGNQLLYSAYSNEHPTVWEMSADGNDQHQVLPNDFAASQICLSADGRYLVFQSALFAASEIWRANLDGSDPQQLTNGGHNFGPGVAGEWVFYTSARDDRNTIWRVSINGGGQTQLTDKFSSWPTPSPDGKYIACIYADPALGTRERLAIIPFGGGSPIKTFEVPQTALLNNRFSWSPDGKAILYKDLVHGLWRQELTKDKPQTVKGFETTRLYYFAWSRDGKNLAYTTGTATKEIVLIQDLK